MAGWVIELLELFEIWYERNAKPFFTLKLPSETAVGRCFSKKVFLKIVQYWHENTYVGVSFY